MSKTKIEWCDYTINPVVGCQKCSPGCENCYAEKFAARLAKNPKTKWIYEDVVDKNGKWNGEQAANFYSAFDKLPKKPCRIFVCSMADLFLTNDPAFIKRLFAGIVRYPQHTFCLLTKRPENAQDYDFTPYPNIWLGVTVCNQQESNVKIPLLLKIPAAKHFVSVEPMLGSVVIPEIEKLDWIICGGETGPKSRQMKSKWVYPLRDQCVAANVPFFFKQWGNWYDAIPSKYRIVDDREWNQAPEPVKPLPESEGV